MWPKSLTLFIIISNLVNGKEHNWLDILKKDIIDNVKPYQLAIFMNNTKPANFDRHNLIINELLNIIPSITIDSEQLALTGNNTCFNLPIFVNLRQAATYVMINNGIKVSEATQIVRIKNFIDLFVPTSHEYPKPKCLVLHVDNKMLPGIFFKSLLEYAWSKKFLDFTIIKLNIPSKFNHSSYPTMYSFNPFFDILTKKRFDSKVGIFPNKLRNVNGYPLKLPAYDDPPFVTTTKDMDGNIVRVKTFFSSLLEEAAREINFSIEYNDVAQNDSSARTRMILKKLRINELDIHNILLTPFDRENFSYFGVGTGYPPFFALVPILKTNKLIIPEDMMTYLFTIPLIVILMVYGAHLIRIHKENWSAFLIFQVLFTIPVKMNPQSLSEKLIFLSIVLISLRYSTDFFAKFLDMSVIQDEISFDTLAEIDDSSFNIYVKSHFYGSMFNTDQEAIMKLKEKTIRVSSIIHCVEMIKAGRQAICITSKLYAEYFTDQYGELMKIAKPVIFYDRLAYTAQSSWPYTQIFHDTFHRIHSSGILRSFQNAFSSGYSYQEEEQSIDGNFTNNILRTILIISGGFVVSVLVFLIELLMTPSLISGVRRFISRVIVAFARRFHRP